MPTIDAPLTREEMSAFLLYNNDRFKELTDIVVKKLDATIESQNTLASIIKEVSRKTDIQNVYNIKSDVIEFKSSFSINQQELWTEKVQGEIAAFCLENGKDRDTIYGLLYGQMGAEGINLPELLSLYAKESPNATILSMVAASDNLRARFVDVLDKTIVRNKTEIKAEEPMFLKSRERVATPPEVKTLVSKIIGKDKPNGFDYCKVFSMLDIDVDEYMKEFREKHGFKTCGTAYAISVNPDLMTKLRNIAAKKRG